MHFHPKVNFRTIILLVPSDFASGRLNVVHICQEAAPSNSTEWIIHIYCEELCAAADTYGKLAIQETVKHVHCSK